MKNTLITLFTILVLAFSTFAAEVSIQDTEADKGSAFVVPIDIQEGIGLFALQWHLTFDPRVVHPIGTNFGCSTKGTVARDLTPTCNVEGHTLNVAIWGAYPLTEDGIVLNVRFIAVGGGDSPLTFSELSVYDPVNGLVKSESVDGTVTVY